MIETTTQRSSERSLLTLPPGRGTTLRDGKALAMAPGHRETGPDDRRTATSRHIFDTADCVLTTSSI